MHEVEASLAELVRYMFIENKTDTKVYMNIPYGEHGIRDNHDLFVFCLDLLCKGLVLLYGDEQNKVPIDSLSQDQLAYVTMKLLNAGILLKVETKEIITPQPDSLAIKPRIYKADGNELTSYKMLLVSKGIEYTIQFELTRI